MVAFELIVGSIGLVCLLLAFILNSFKQIGRESYMYNMLNFIGAFLLVYYAFTLNSIVFIILESIWGLVALYMISKKLIKRR